MMLVDDAKQAGPIGCSGSYQLKSHLKIIFFQVEYLGAYVHVLFFSSGNLFLILLLQYFYICCQQAAIALRIWPN